MKSITQVIVLSVLILTLTSCNTSAPGQPAATRTSLATPTSESTSTPTLSPTPLSDEMVNSILQTYKAMVLVQVNAEMLNETAQRVASGELSGIQEMSVMLGLATLIKSVDEAVPQITPPDVLTDSWNDVLGLHDQTKDILRRWVNQEIYSDQVVTEMQSVLVDVDDAVSGAEDVLARAYDFDPALLAQQRQEILGTVSTIFETPTPTPSQ